MGEVGRGAVAQASVRTRASGTQTGNIRGIVSVCQKRWLVCGLTFRGSVLPCLAQCLGGIIEHLGHHCVMWPVLREKLRILGTSHELQEYRSPDGTIG